MPRLITDIPGVYDLENQLLSSGAGGTGGCCVLGDGTLQLGLTDIPEPTEDDIILAADAAEDSLVNTMKRMYTSMQDPNFSPEDMMIFAKIAKDNQLQVLNAPGITVALLNKLASLLSVPSNTPRDLLMLEQARALLREASKPEICPDSMGRYTIVEDHTFDDFGRVILENIQG